MTDYTASRLGANNDGTDKLELFLKTYAGEVLGAFDENNIMKALHRIRTILSGKSASFPVTGKNTAFYHTPGNEITGAKILHSERVINIDGKLVADTFIADIDEAMNHYDVRGEYAKQNGEALARVYDKNILRVLILAARAAATITGGNGGTVLTNANYLTDSTVLAAGIANAALSFDQKDVPEGERYAVFKPAQYRLLTQNTTLINQDWDGNGSLSKGKIYEYQGVQLLKSNNLPQANDTSNTDIAAAYRANYSTVAGVVFHTSAVGTVELMGLKSEAEYQMERQGTLMLSSMAIGTGILRPEASCELKTA